MIFRYPGGKSKYFDAIYQHLEPLITNSGITDYYEPFIGGGSVLCKIAMKFPKLKLNINDFDRQVICFWWLFAQNKQSFFDKFYELLKQKPTIHLFNDLRNKQPTTKIEKAYYAVFFNRTTFSGIYRAGPIGGYTQHSKWTIDCRYNFKNMYEKIEKMREVLDGRLYVYNEHIVDFFEVINDETGVMYLDPPYYKQGKKLYPIYMENDEHKTLSNLLKHKKNWVLSYDKCNEIKNLYLWATITDMETTYTVSGKNRTNIKNNEYIIIPNQQVIDIPSDMYHHLQID